ncbi:hypothetical protein V8E55_005030 [Tylopilus felleus]
MNSSRVGATLSSCASLATGVVLHWNDETDPHSRACAYGFYRSGIESSKVEIEVYARRFFFSYKVIKKTESKETLADLLEHSETPVELELLEEGQAAGKLVFKISKSPGAAAKVEVPPAVSTEPADTAPAALTITESPKQGP